MSMFSVLILQWMACVRSELCLFFEGYKTCWRRSKSFLHSLACLFYGIKFIS